MTRPFALGLIAAIAWLPGCSGVPIPPTYTTEELAVRCARNGGVWRPLVADGYCEYQSPGFL